VALSSAPAAASAPHTARWYSHISALLGSRCDPPSTFPPTAAPPSRRGSLTRPRLPAASFPGKAVGVSVGGASSAAAAAAPAAAAKPAAAADDSDDELDLFGDDTEEEKAAKAAVIATAKARGEEKAKLSKSMIILNVKPWDDETDLAELEKHVRAVEQDGLLWGASKLVPVGYGIKMLQITCIIQDSKVPSFDAIIEDFLVQDGENAYIQARESSAVRGLAQHSRARHCLRSPRTLPPSTNCRRRWRERVGGAHVLRVTTTRNVLVGSLLPFCAHGALKLFVRLRAVPLFCRKQPRQLGPPPLLLRLTGRRQLHQTPGAAACTQHRARSCGERRDGEGVAATRSARRVSTTLHARTRARAVTHPAKPPN